MKQANSDLFAHIESYCTRRGESIDKAGAIRYVSSSNEDKKFLQNLKVGASIKFGNFRSLSHLRLGSDEYIALIGFDFEPDLPALSLSSANGGMVVCLLSTIKPSPLVGPATARNFIEVGSLGEDGYIGHSSTALETLFPPIQVFECTQQLDADAVWRVFLMVCAQECMQGGSWVESELAEELVTLTDLNVPSMPYAAICRSMFDADPRSLFMALYRCIEATYAYESSRRLVEKLGIQVDWQDMAAALDSEVGWHPQEAQSLNLVLQHAVEQDLREVCNCLGVQVGTDVHATAGRAIYTLRNKIVHYRAGSSESGDSETDWNRLCYLLIGVVFNVFTRAYV